MDILLATFLISPNSMKRLLLLALFVIAAAASQAAERPNIIWIMADDLGYGEIGCFGQQLMQTPNIDRMASEGRRFTQFYAGATVCAPSRSVLMTGQHHGRTRVRGNAGPVNLLAQALRAEDVTVAKVLKEAGYTTALIGKWGLGDAGAAECGLPRRHGFDYFFGFLNQQHAHNHFPDFLWRNEEKVALPNEVTRIGETGAGYATKPVQFADDLFADEVLKFVEAQKEKPFFLYWAPVIPHGNNERTKALKDGAEVPDYGAYADREWSTPAKGHAAMVSRLDSYVGRLLDKLKKQGLAEKTLVVFTSDNGPHKESGHDPELFEPYGAVSGYKRDLKDGGIRVPFVAWWPEKITAGTESTHVAYAGDFMATAAELAGVKAPENIQSISFLPSLLGHDAEQKKHDFLYWEFHERGFSQAALYQGRWKGIRNGPRTPLALYDLQSDLRETTNVATAHPEIVGKIEAYLETARSESADWPIRTSQVRRARR